MNKPEQQHPPEPAGSEPDSNLELALARANLLRLRRQWREAASECLAILRTEPANVDAHTLLGDIQVELGEPRQAQHWYRLALTLAPDNESVRRKLDKVVDQTPAPAPAPPVREPIATSEAQNAEVSWSTRLATLGVLSALGLALLLGTYSLGRGDRTPARRFPQARALPAGRHLSPPTDRSRVKSKVVSPSKGAAEPASKAKDSSPRKQAVAPVQQKAKNASTPLLTRTERRLLEELRAALSTRKEGGYALYGLTFDPTVGTVIVTFQSPVRTPTASSRSQVVARARDLARLLVSKLPEASILTLRAAVRDGDRLDLVFVGVATRAALKQPAQSPLFVPEWWATN